LTLIHKLTNTSRHVYFLLLGMTRACK